MMSKKKLLKNRCDVKELGLGLKPTEEDVDKY